MNLIEAGPNTNVVFTNNIINGQKISNFTYLDGKLETDNEGAPVNIVLTKEKKIKFHGADYEVIPFIESCIKKLTGFINTAYDFIEA